MNAAEFEATLRELVEENPLAIRAVLKILRTEFTDSVPTLAVTCEAQPRLLVNLRFVTQHCRSETEVKAVICHEFLHVLLRHTERFTRLTPADHLALDAVINAIIHRSLGPEYSRLMSRYYADAPGVQRLLRPPTREEQQLLPHRFSQVQSRKITARERRVLDAWDGLYKGMLCADDIRDVARDLAAADGTPAPDLLGDHDGLEQRPDRSDPGADALAQALDQSLRAMNGTGIFRSPRDRQFGAPAYSNAVPAANLALERWRREAYAVLRQHLLPDARSRATETAAASFTLPVLSTTDRRAVLRARWSPFLPEALWHTEVPARAGTAHVYLDVSGSMNAEMPHIVALLGRLGRYIRRPFWAFSDVVAPARIEQGRLVADTTGGTSMACVLRHLAQTRPRAAVVVTDGYIETVNRKLLAATAGIRLHALVTRGGNPAALVAAGIPCTQLARIPT